MNRLPFLAIAASTGFSLPVTASVITQRASASDVAIQVLGPNSPQQPAPFAMNFQRFDPSLGQLNSVTARVTYQAQASVGVENVEGRMVNLNAVSVGLVHNLRFNGDLANAPVGFFTGIDASNLTLASFDGNLDFQGASGVGGSRLYAQTIDYVFDARSLTVQSPTAPSFASPTNSMRSTFTGQGTVPIELFMQSQVWIDAASPSLFAVQQPTDEAYDVAIELTYAFTPIPSPSALPLGLMGALAARRRRR